MKQNGSAAEYQDEIDAIKLLIDELDDKKKEHSNALLEQLTEDKQSTQTISFVLKKHDVTNYSLKLVELRHLRCALSKLLNYPQAYQQKLLGILSDKSSIVSHYVDIILGK